jgi:hypothetical protein
VKNAPKNSPSSFDQTELQNVQAKISATESKLKSFSNNSRIEAEDLKTNVPLSQWGDYKKDWRRQKEKLVIDDPSHYALSEGKITRTFTLDLSGTTDYQLGIVNKAWAPLPKKNNVDDESSNDFRRYFEASIKCDADFKIKKTLFSKSVAKNKDISFRIYEQENNSPKVLLFLNQKVSNCEIFFKDPENPDKNYGIKKSF